MSLTLIKTGGTIGCATGADGVRRLKPQFHAGSFDKEVAPFTMLSENLEFGHIKILAETVEREAAADGIVITHGTDTLPYTAAALSFILAGISIPVVLVSAAVPAEEEGSNAQDNMQAALSFIRCGMGGVFAAYTNEGELPQILFGSRMLEARAFDGNYYAPKGLVCAYVNQTAQIKEKAIGLNPVKPKFGKIQPMSYYTGGEYAVSETAPDAYLFNGSHSGTVNTKRVNEFILKANAPVYIAGGLTGTVYESRTGIKGARFLDNIAYPAAYMKLALGYGNFEGDMLTQYLYTCAANEFF